MSSFFVRKSGSDANAGTSAGAAKLTITAGLALMAAGGADTLYVGAGSYAETVTLPVSGTDANNRHSIIGDYTGVNTGDAGIVRITGSNNNITATRTNALVAVTKSFWNITGFVMDLTTGSVVSLDGCTFITGDKLHLTSTAAGFVAWIVIGAAQLSCIIKNSRLSAMNASASALLFFHSSTVDNTGHLVQSCEIGPATSAGVGVTRVGGITINGGAIWGSPGGNAVQIVTVPAVGQIVTVTNVDIYGCNRAFSSAGAGVITENYNHLFANGTDRVNVSVGANSDSKPTLLDARPWMAMAHGGRLVTPWDHASYSAQVELSAGSSGAPATDARGAGTVGSFREPGLNEYDATLAISGGAVSISPVRGGVGG